MTTTTTTTNAYCVILGTPGQTPLTIVGPFPSNNEAQAHAAEHVKANPQVLATADLLVNPANC